MEIRTEDFAEPGLYLLLQGGKKIVLTEEKVRSFAQVFGSNLSEVPAEVREAVDFQACSVCPEKDRLTFCHALPATLAFFAELDEFNSYDSVSAVYRGLGRNLVCALETTMQEALQYVAMLSLLFYCEIGAKYWKFFQGIHPLMEPSEMVDRIHLNLYRACKGDEERIERVLQTFADEIACTCQCQVKRLRLICKHDALLNAFAGTHALIECLVATRGSWFEQVSAHSSV